MPTATSPSIAPNLSDLYPEHDPMLATSFSWPFTGTLSTNERRAMKQSALKRFLLIAMRKRPSLLPGVCGVPQGRSEKECEMRAEGR